MRFILFLLPAAAVACTGDDTIFTPDSGDDGEDLECPSIQHIPVTSPQTIAVPVTVSATITDESGVSTAIVYYKVETAIIWDDKELDNGGSGDEYSVEIPGKEVGGAGGMHYYIWAQDASPNLNACTRPTDGEEGPFHFTIDAP